MKESSDGTSNEHEEAVKSERERTIRANEVCRKACEERGVKVASWHHFQAWKEYVDGKIGDSQLTDKARSEMEQFSGSFGIYLVIERKEDPDQLKKEEEKKKRAKQANQIYRKVCQEAGIKVCFFNDFGSWSNYVEGKITESEFYEKAKLEVESIAAKSQAGI